MRTELVTTLKRKASKLIDELNKKRGSILITQHGLPSAYLVDAVTFEQLRERIEILEGIALGERAIEKGESMSHAEAKKALGKWFKSPGPTRR